MLSRITDINPNRRKIYDQSGIEPLLKHGRVGGFKKSVVSKEQHDKRTRKLNDPKNGLRGYTERLDWVNKDLSKDMKYITLVKHAERNFGSKIKLCRNSHVKKDQSAVDTFKKTSLKNVRKGYLNE
ncbi:MAG: hypothetical protein ABIT58_10705 [Ferruginibacter sp.]